MVGKVGTLQTPSATNNVVMEAIKLATAWTGGWETEGKEAFRAEMSNLETVSAQNHEVYTQASALIADISKREAKLKLDARELEKASAAWTTRWDKEQAAIRKVHQENSEAAAKLASERRAFEAERDAVADLQSDERKALDDRENLLNTIEKALEEREANVTDREREAEGRLSKANSMIDGMKRVMAAYG